MALNQCVFHGRLTRDPETKQLPGGSSVTEFAIAVNDKYKDKQGNMQENVMFLDVTAFGAQGGVISQYLKKGQGVIVSGKLQQDKWQDQATGQNRSKFKLMLRDFDFVGGGAGNQNGGVQQQIGNVQHTPQPVQQFQQPGIQQPAGLQAQSVTDLF